MEEAGLKKVATILHTQAVLVANPKTTHTEEIETLRRRIQGYLFAKNWSMMYYNITRKDLKKAELITPGRRAPTISPLDDPDWVSVGAMVKKKEIAEKMDELQKMGASDIMVIDISNCRA